MLNRLIDRTWRSRVGVIAVAVGLCVASTQALYQTPSDPCAQTHFENIESDSLHYLPGDTVTVAGKGFAPSCSVGITLNLPGGLEDQGGLRFVTTDGAGNFSYAVVLGSVTGDYSVQAVTPDGISLGTAPFTSGIFVVTDKPEYKPGETAKFSGRGFAAGETVLLLVEQMYPSPHSYQRWLSAIADGTGAFLSGDFTLQEFDRDTTLSVTAIGQASGRSAQTTFADATFGFVQKRTNQTTQTDVTSLTSTAYSPAPIQGNLLVAVVGTFGPATISMTSAGWTQDINETGGAGVPSQAIFHKIAGASESTSVVVGLAGATFSSTGSYVFATAPNRITRAAGSFLVDGFGVGQTITTTSPSNTGTYTITAVNAAQITVTETITAAAAASTTITGVGTTATITTYEFSGALSSSDPGDGTASTTGTGTTVSASSASLTPTSGATTDLLFAGLTANGGSTTLTYTLASITNGFTVRVAQGTVNGGGAAAGNNQRVASQSADRTNSAASNTTSMTIGAASFPWRGQIAAFKAKSDTTIAYTSVAPASPSVFGQTVTFTATVSVTPNSGSGTGPVGGTATFRDAGTPLSECTNVPVVAGVATCNVTTLTAAAHGTLTAIYNGDGANYNASPASPNFPSYTVVADAAACFKSAATGNWNVQASWLQATTCAGVFSPATSLPSSNALGITIQGGHTITVTAASTARSLTIDALGDLEIASGGTLTHSVGSLTVNGVLGVSGTLVTTAATISGLLDVNSGGLINSSANAFTVTTGGQWTIDSGGAANTGNITIDAGGSATWNGPVSVNSGSGTTTATLNGTVNASDDISLASISNLQIGGTVTMTAGTLTVDRGNGGSVGQINSGGSLVLQGSSILSLAGAATSTFSVLSGGTLDMGPGAIVNGSRLIVGSGANLKIGSTAGISTTAGTGNVRTTGTGDAYATDASYEYAGTAAQVTGNKLPATVRDLTVNNSGPANVTLTNAITVNGTLSLLSGDLVTGANRVWQNTSASAAVILPGASWSGGVATLTIGSHSLLAGQSVAVAGIVPAGYNDPAATITAVTGTTISYAVAANPGAYTSGGTVTFVPTSAGTTDVVGTVVRLGAETLGTAYTYGNPDNRIQVDTGSFSFTSIGTLNAAITAPATSFAVNETATPPALPFIIKIDSEQMNVTARVATATPGRFTYTVTRGANGSTAASHLIAASVTVAQISVTLAKSAPAGKADAVTRTYTISPTPDSGFAATLRLHYLDGELNSNTEGGLNLWRLVSGTWTEQLSGTTTRDSSNNWVQLDGVTGFSDWTIAAPSIVTTTTAVALITGTNPSTYGDSLAFRATVSPTPTGGDVTFYEGGTCSSPGSLLQAASTVNGAGQVSFATAAFGATAHTVLACYAGTTGFTESSGSLGHTVNRAMPTASITNTPQPYTGAPQTAAVACLGGGTATLASGGTGTDAGSYPATVDCAQSTNYNAAAGLLAGDFVIERIAPTASITNTPQPYTGAPQTAAVACLGGGVATLASGGTGTDAGSYPATVDCAQSTNYNAAAGLLAGDFVIERIAPTASITNTPQPYTGAPQTAAVACLGGGVATLASGGTGTDAGSYPATVDCAQSTNYNAAAGLLAGDFVIERIAPTASITNTPQPYTGAPQTAAVACLGGGTATLASGGTGTDAGSYPATVDCAQSTNYNAAAGLLAGDFVIERIAPTASITNTPQPYTGAPQTAAVACLGGGVATLASGGTGTDAGSYPATVDCAQSTNYNAAAGLLAGDFVIERIAPTASITNTPQPYTGAPQTAAVACLGGGVATLASGGTGTDAGSYPATVDCAQSTNYNAAAGLLAGDFVIERIAPTASITNTPQPYTGAPQTAAVACLGGGVATLASGGTGTDAGSYPATVDCAQSTNYNAAAGLLAGDFVIERIAPTASITNTPQPYTGAPQTAAVACLGGGTATLASGGTGTDAGSYPATVDCAQSTNYNAAAGLLAGDFVIERIAPTASITNTPQPYTGAPQTAAVACLGGGVATLASGGTGTDAGSYPATVDCAQSTNYNAAAGLLAGDFVIERIAPTASITNTPQPYTGAPQTAAVACLGGGVATLASGGTGTDAGSYPATVDCAQSTNYNAAAGLLAGDFVIERIAPTASITNTPQPYTGAPQTAAVACLGGGVATLASGGTGTDAGSYPATVDCAQSTNYNAATGLAAGNFVITQVGSTTVIICPVSVPYTGSALAPCTAQATGVGMAPVNVSGSLVYGNNTNPGTASATASWGGDLNHTGSIGFGSFEIVIVDGNGDRIPDFISCTSLFQNRVVYKTGTPLGTILEVVLPASRRHASLQAAVTAAADNDVIAFYTDTTENTVIGTTTGSGSKDLRIVGCGHKVTAALATQPVITVENSAGANDGNTGAGEADIHVDDVNVLKGSTGYLIQTSTTGSNHTSTLLKAIRSDQNGPSNGTGAATVANPGHGVKIEGDGNEVRGANSIGTNSGDGIQVAGNSNTLRQNRITKNRGDGIDVTGNSNELDANPVGEKNLGNKANGIVVSGNGNTIEQNDVYGNTLVGIKTVGGTNTLSKNDVGESGKGNGGNGIDVSGGNGNVLSENNVFANTGMGVKVAGMANTLNKNDVGDKGKGNGGDGINVAGDGNLLGKDLNENNVFANGGNGIVITGNNNSLVKNDVGDKGKGNKLDGIKVVGYGNTLTENNSFANGFNANGTANGGDGYDISGGTAAKPNVLVKNNGGANNAGNGGNGFLLAGVGNGTGNPSVIELDQNTASSNKLDGFKVTGTGWQLADNKSDNNGKWEFEVVPGNFNAGGNKANGGAAIPGAMNSPFPPTAGTGS